MREPIFLGGELAVRAVLVHLDALLYTTTEISSPSRRRPRSFDPTSLIDYRRPDQFDVP